MSTTELEEDLKQALKYDPQTGILVWGPGTKFAGKQAGHVTKRGHLTVNRGKKSLQAHRVAWLLHYGKWPTNGIDHIDGNPGNNRIANLRDVGQQDNNRNKCTRKDSSTRITGVSWCKMAKKWRAYISINKRPVRLGYYDDFESAVIARKQAEQQYGYHPNHGRS